MWEGRVCIVLARLRPGRTSPRPASLHSGNRTSAPHDARDARSVSARLLTVRASARI